jgi:DNA-directed RNA polymerase subunit alpha
MLQIQCIESKQEETNAIVSRFSIGPLHKGQGITVGNALRRALLSNLAGLAIVGVRIADVDHEFSTIPNVKEDVIEILLNLKQLVLKGHITEPIVARLNYQGPGIVTAKDIELPKEISLVEPRQYIASVTSSTNFEMEFLIEKGEGYSLNNTFTSLPKNFLAIDAVFMPVKRVNFFVETSPNEITPNCERLNLEVYTDGSITPTEAVSSAAELLQKLFGSLRITNLPSSSNSLVEKVKEDKGHEMNNILIEELELSVRAYNCLKRANVHTVKGLLQYSKEDLLEFKNFGQKSADEVCESLKARFGKILKK